jgi:hypothetical protein
MILYTERKNKIKVKQSQKDKHERGCLFAVAARLLSVFQKTKTQNCRLTYEYKHATIPQSQKA